MRAIARNVLAAVAACVASLATPADDPNRAVEIALANALDTGNTQAAAELFNPKMPGAAKVRSGLQDLIRQAELALEINTDTGVWTLRIVARDVAAGVTTRQAKVQLRTEAGRIESFEPSDFLEPPHGAGAWNALYSFATALTDENASPPLDQFDSATPGLAELKSDVAALWTRYQIDSSLDMLSNEGDDVRRTLRIDWTLTLKNRQDPVDSFRREQTLTCRIDQRGKSWRIVSIDPIGFFSPAR